MIRWITHVVCHDIDIIHIQHGHLPIHILGIGRRSI